MLMSKLIKEPSECGYHSCLNECCNYPDVESSVLTPTQPPLPCPNDEFPNYCPLPDGIIARRVFKTPRRNKFKCAFYATGTISKGNCMNKHFYKPGSMVYPKCMGVNCGQFALPVKY